MSLTTSLQVAGAAAVRRIMADPAVPIDMTAPGGEGYAVRKAAEIVVDEVRPLVEHIANQEPWYQSRVTWGAIIAGAAPLAGLLGREISAEDQMQMVSALAALGTLIGVAVTLYGRWRAMKPIGA